MVSLKSCEIVLMVGAPQKNPVPTCVRLVMLGNQRPKWQRDIHHKLEWNRRLSDQSFDIQLCHLRKLYSSHVVLQAKLPVPK